MTRIPAEIRDPQTYAVLGAAIEVHKELGALISNLWNLCNLWFIHLC